MGVRSFVGTVGCPVPVRSSGSGEISSEIHTPARCWQARSEREPPRKDAATGLSVIHTEVRSISVRTSRHSEIRDRAAWAERDDSRERKVARMYLDYRRRRVWGQREGRWLQESVGRILRRYGLWVLSTRMLGRILVFHRISECLRLAPDLLWVVAHSRLYCVVACCFFCYEPVASIDGAHGGQGLHCSPWGERRFSGGH